MEYTKFIVKNFKGIKDTVTFDFNLLPKTNIFTLVGLNESGKTSILEAFYSLQKGYSQSEAHKMIHKSEKGNFNEEISIQAELTLDEYDEKRINDYCKTNINLELTEKIEKLVIIKKYIFKNSKCEKIESLWTINLTGKRPGKSKKIFKLYNENKEEWDKVIDYIKDYFPKILYYEDFLFDFPQKIYLEEKSGVSYDKNEVEYRLVLQDILDSFDDNLTIEEHILNRINSKTDEDKEALEALLGDISSKLTDVIFTNWSEVFKKTSKEIELNLDNDLQKGNYIELKIKQGKDKYAINERSLGFRWFFSFLLFTEFRKERKDDFGETLFLLDEPASNLHQKSQTKLLGMFEKLAIKCKIVYSTHSQYLINPKYLAGTYIIKNDTINYDDEDDFNQNETKISATLYKNFASQYPDEKDHYKPILDAIDYIPAEMDLVEDIVCFEGKYDYYTFMYIQDNFMKTKYKFYPGASVDKYDELFRLYIAWQKNVIAIFDSDAQGKKAQQRYISEISNDLTRSIFILEDIDDTWKNICTENLFSKVDQIKIIQTCWPDEKKYNKSKLNTSIQNLYINNIQLELEETTIKNFEKIFEFIKMKNEVVKKD